MMKYRLSITLSALLLGLTTGIPALADENDFGQLHSLNEALQQAGLDCDDRNAYDTVKYWVRVVIDSEGLQIIAEDIPPEGGPPPLSRTLLEQLWQIRRQSENPVLTCENIRQAAETTEKLLNSLPQAP